MADPTPIVAALIRELVKTGVVEARNDQPEPNDGMVGVHVSWALDELTPALVRTWRDPDGHRIHCEVRWKPE